MTSPDALAAQLASFFASRHGIAAVYLFGSRAAGRAHRESDVDVAILVDRAAFPNAESRFELRVTLGSELIGVLHLNEVDVVILNDAPPLFARRILFDGMRVHCADQELEHAFRRDTQLRAADLGPFLERNQRRRLAAILR